MNFSRTLSFAAIGAALLITVPAKLGDYNVVADRVSDDLERSLVSFLNREGFRTEIGHRFGAFEINAYRGGCRLQIKEAAAQGYNTDEIAAKLPKDAALVFAYRGKLWISHPTFRATVAQIWNRLRWRFGIDDAWSPVVAIASVGACPVDALPWRDIAIMHAAG